MRTNIEIDDQLMRQAMRCSGARTKKATVEAGVHLLVETHGQRAISRLRAKCGGRATLTSHASDTSQLPN